MLAGLTIIPGITPIIERDAVAVQIRSGPDFFIIARSFDQRAQPFGRGGEAPQIYFKTVERELDIIKLGARRLDLGRLALADKAR